MNLLKVAKRFGTPLYVYDQSVIEKRCRELRRNFPGVRIHYAVKANSNPAIIAITRKEGLGVETVSPGEIRVSKAAGVKKEAVSFTCSNQTVEELVFAAKHAGIVHIDSLVQLETWGKKKLGREASLRINEGIGTGHHRHVVTGGPDSKFGISLKDIGKAWRIAEKYHLKITGLEQHIGSNMLGEDASIFLRSVRKLMKTARDFTEVKHLDFGGGFGVPYKPWDKPLDLSELGKEFTRITRSFAAREGRRMTFALEPGRFVVAESGTLLVSVVDIKSTSKHSFIGVNSGFNHLIRPSMYGSYHPITNLSRRGRKIQATVAGNVCESVDVFAWDRALARPSIGDILSIGFAGAYGMTMASNYNLRPLPREVLVFKGRAKDISFSPEQYVR